MAAMMLPPYAYADAAAAAYSRFRCAISRLVSPRDFHTDAAYAG